MRISLSLSALIVMVIAEMVVSHPMALIISPYVQRGFQVRCMFRQNPDAGIGLIFC